jgi:hypothetical protein
MTQMFGNAMYVERGIGMSPSVLTRSSVEWSLSHQDEMLTVRRENHDQLDMFDDGPSCDIGGYCMS